MPHTNERLSKSAVYRSGERDLPRHYLVVGFPARQATAGFPVTCRLDVPESRLAGSFRDRMVISEGLVRNRRRGQR